MKMKSKAKSLVASLLLSASSYLVAQIQDQQMQYQMPSGISTTPFTPTITISPGGSMWLEPSAGFTNSKGEMIATCKSSSPVRDCKLVGTHTLDEIIQSRLDLEEAVEKESYKYEQACQRVVVTCKKALSSWEHSLTIIQNDLKGTANAKTKAKAK